MSREIIANNKVYSKSELITDTNFLGYAMFVTGKSMTEKNSPEYISKESKYLFAAFTKLIGEGYTAGFTADEGVRGNISMYNNNELFAGMLIGLLDYYNDDDKKNNADVAMMRYNCMRCVETFLEIDVEKIPDYLKKDEVNNPNSLVSNVTRAFIMIHQEDESINSKISDYKLDKDNYLKKEILFRLAIDKDNVKSEGKGR